jgi:hypothetical protein
VCVYVCVLYIYDTMTYAHPDSKDAVRLPTGM